jgi:hypothetical protein
MVAADITYTVLTYTTLGFVPILFFSNRDSRRLISSIVCWQSGYLFLFISHLPPEKVNVVTLLSIAQGIFVAVILRAVSNNTFFAKDVEGLSDRNYFSAVFIMSSLVFLAVMPIIFAFKKGTPQFSSMFICKILGSMILPVLFCFRVHRLMKVQPH